jgi:hypothetical protein
MPSAVLASAMVGRQRCGEFSLIRVYFRFGLDYAWKGGDHHNTNTYRKARNRVHIILPLFYWDLLSYDWRSINYRLLRTSISLRYAHHTDSTLMFAHELT